MRITTELGGSLYICLEVAQAQPSDGRSGKRRVTPLKNSFNIFSIDTLASVSRPCSGQYRNQQCQIRAGTWVAHHPIHHYLKPQAPYHFSASFPFPAVINTNRNKACKDLSAMNSVHPILKATGFLASRYNQASLMLTSGS